MSPRFTRARSAHVLIALSCLCLGRPASAQSVAPVPQASAAASGAPSTDGTSGRSRWSVSWGWNRETYGHSDIHFRGRDHDFTLHDVAAADKQTTLSAPNIVHTYLNPGRITIPQTNVRVAYQVDEDLALAFNLDHMKYVVSDGQSVPITGQILGVPQAGRQLLNPSFMHYEHTDGLNILTLEVEKQYPLDWFGADFPSRVLLLAGAGVVVPKSNVTMTMIGQTRNDEFHLAGYSADLAAAWELDVGGSYFARLTGKLGWVDLPHVRTSARGDQASQHFSYQELILAVGVRF